MPRSKDRADLVDRIMAICAIISAAAAVFISVYEARLNRAHQRISVWPYLSQYNSYAGATYTRNIANRGLGPSLVESFEVRVDGVRKSNWNEVIADLTGLREPVQMVYSTFGTGTVLLPGHSVTVLELPPGDHARRFAANSTHLRTRVCYCSLYRECWVSDSADPAPVRVDDCAEGGKFPG